MRGRALPALRRLAGLEDDTQRPYACRGCGAEFDVQYHVCPECGGFSVEAAPC